MSDNYLTVKDTAKYLNIHWQTIRNYIKKGQLPYFKVGRSYRINKTVVDDFARRISNKGEQRATVEIERRFLVKNRKRMETKLQKLGAKLIGHNRIVDHWFTPHFVKNMQSNLDFVENPHGYTLRIREVEDSYSERKTVTLEVKKIADKANHGNLIEQEIVIPSYEAAVPLLNLMSHKEIVIIDKARDMYLLDGIKFAFDTIKGFGEGLEIEIKSTQSIITSEKKIFKAAELLGLTKKDAIEKSLTYLAMRKLADFS